ncbi:hypothetical protein S2M10_27990 [Sphingomonas sp. S2M10]|uniref:hypothetical protein n=1 Tax=Sphingomonas sp. S2M10 TaxID=2705010 RepID=UPI0014565D80|nr:hypothetical protein [Sphingomonas sp. S2M10]NLS27797.1 hypothetical protein [Sphingomonas sp. S2M10]
MILALALLALAGPRETIGIFARWGAFRDTGPTRCFAIARPADTARRGEAYVSIASWPGQGVRHQLYVRLSRARADHARVMLVAGEWRFELTASRHDAWAPDARTDAAIVAAMRDGRALSVESVDIGGVPFVDGYALQGAASAIDAATLACL